MILILLAGLAHAACTAPILAPEPAGSEPGAPCVGLDLDIAGRAFARWPSVGLTRGIHLQRMRAEVALRSKHDVQLRLAVMPARSGGADGYVGIEGEAWVPLVQNAEVRWDAREAGFAVAAGIVDDPWTMIVQPAWGRRDIAAPMVSDQGWTARSDEGAWAGWTSADARMTLLASVSAGEGANRRERNEVLDAGATVVVRPVTGDVGLDLAVHARKGARGLLAARNDRVAAAAILRTPRVVGGVDGLVGWGLAGDGARQPAGISAWARSGPAVPVVGWARADVSWDDRTVGTSREIAVLAGGGPRLPVGEPRAVWIVGGVEVRRYEADAAPIAGTGSVAGTELVFVQLGGRLIDAIPLGRD